MVTLAGFPTLDSFPWTVCTVNGWHPHSRTAGWKALQAEKARLPQDHKQKKTPKKEEKTGPVFFLLKPRIHLSIYSLILNENAGESFDVPPPPLQPLACCWLASLLTSRRHEDVCLVFFHARRSLSHLPPSSLTSFPLVFFPANGVWIYSRFPVFTSFFSFCTSFERLDSDTFES